MNNINIEELIENYKEIVSRFTQNNSNTIPFCAAEPIVSNFVKSGLNTEFFDRYIKSGVTSFDPSKEFIGSEYIFPIYEQISLLCNDLFECQYADPRPLSGMNTALTVLMSLTEVGDNILLLAPDAGGHSSYIEISRRLGLNVTLIPYNFEKLEYDIIAINKLLNKKTFKAIVIGPSDLISPPPFEQFNIPSETLLIYDATQSLGLIAAKIHNNPLHIVENSVLIGGTHKTISGPTSGLILCNNQNIYTVLEKKVSPTYIRNPHPHHIVSLLLALIEFKKYGLIYMQTILKNVNLLGKSLSDKNFDVLRCNNGDYSNTHQLFISLPINERDNIELVARRLNISLDKRSRPIYGGSGLRLGVQAITRLGWERKEINLFSQLLSDIRQSKEIEDLNLIASKLRGKNKVLYSIS